MHSISSSPRLPIVMAIENWAILNQLTFASSCPVFCGLLVFYWTRYYYMILTPKTIIFG